ncbi:phage tail protein [Arvimicrobium flavum]|uniref:phage tail protein n=1 Tax=Arvimicrobium flavum TaxID=3393320 RepID=UPI00237B265D|nr:phage tail protein [Mesorhizobium shangrilense]
MAFNVKVTALGLAAFANALINSTPVVISEVAIGDGGGAPITPTGNETTLYNELNRHPVTGAAIHADNANWIVVDTIVPAEAGGFTIREVGIYADNGDLLAIASYPEQYKPTLAEGFGEDLAMKLIMEVTNAASVTIIDGGTVLYATRTYVQNLIHQTVNWYNQNW